jgi:hypothetical protein
VVNPSWVAAPPNPSAPLINRVISIIQLIVYPSWINLTTNAPRINDPNWRVMSYFECSAVP